MAAGSPELRAIETVCGVRNAQLGLTGALLHDGATFFQVLEGPPDPLRAVFASISRDPRHRGVTGLIVRPVRERRFPRFRLKPLPCGAAAVSAIARETVAALDLEARAALAERLLSA